MKAKKTIDETGRVFGRLTVLSELPRINYRAMWLCRCACGGERRVAGKLLRNGHVRSCGCLHIETARNKNRTHGQSESREYNTWLAMKQRCLNPKSKRFPQWGGRGITVCSAWANSFDTFIADMGPRPLGCSIERIDNNKGYGPENCRWATRAEQARNTRQNVFITHNGETLCAQDWDHRIGATGNAVVRRVKQLGWSHDRAVSTPVQKRKKGAPLAHRESEAP